MKQLFLLVSFLCLMAGNSGLEAKEISKGTIQKVTTEMMTQHPASNQALMQRGISQAASLWQEQDGNDEAFAKFVKENYMAIARTAAQMVKENDVIFISAATVGFFMVQNLPADLHLRVVTNSIILAEELRRRPNTQVILLGGEMDGKGNCYDAFAIEMLRRLRVDRCFLTSACISPGFGLSIQKSQAIAFWNAVLDSSKQAIGLYPTEKIGFESIVSICPANRLHILLTDWMAEEDDLSAFRDHISRKKHG